MNGLFQYESDRYHVLSILAEATHLHAVESGRALQQRIYQLRSRSHALGYQVLQTYRNCQVIYYSLLFNQIISKSIVMVMEINDAHNN